MRYLVVIMTLFLFSAQSGNAQETGLVTLETGDASRGWEGVGRLDIAGKGFCTASLIQDRLILTAAHCVFGSDGKLLSGDAFQFNAGLRGGRAEATRGVNRLVTHPRYVYSRKVTDADTVANDIAVLELDRPIRLTRVQPFAIAADPQYGDQIGVVSYGRGRENAASLQEVCNVLGLQDGVVVMTCDVEFGSSGAPVFTLSDGKPQIVSVVSSMSKLGEEDISLGTSLNEPLKQLLSHFANVGPAKPGGAQRLVQTGQRNNTGAKFVRP